MERSIELCTGTEASNFSSSSRLSELSCYGVLTIIGAGLVLKLMLMLR